MPTYTADFDYSLHTPSRITYKLVTVEEPEISNHRSKLTVYIRRKNTGSFYYGESQYLNLKINGETIFDGTKYIDNLGEGSEDNIFAITHYITYNSDGTGRFDVEATYKANRISMFTDWVWGTTATTEISGTLTPIDLSAPIISDISVVADRYGSNAYASFKVSHSSYELREVEFKLKGLTDVQAKCRDLMYDNDPPANVNQNYNGIEDGSYYIRLIRDFPIPISQSYECYYPLDDGTDGMHPLESGASYPYEIIATAYNNKTATVTGTLKVPQKATGITCEPEISLILKQSSELTYEVLPNNAEEKGVEFQSSDPTVVTVDTNGKITAVGEGICQITVTTLDGGSPDAVSGFSSVCTINVIGQNKFPELNEIRYLTARDISKIVFACNFLFEKLTEKGVSVSDLSTVACEGRSHPVKEIKSLLETIESNCQLLKNASSSAYPTNSLAEQQDILKQNIELNWYITVNGWVRFLNELNNQIEKEA